MSNTWATLIVAQTSQMFGWAVAHFFALQPHCGTTDLVGGHTLSPVEI